MRLEDLQNSDQQSPINKSFCQSLRRDTHWKCLILTLLITGCLAAITWCRQATVEHVMVHVYDLPFYTKTDRSSPCEDGYVYIPVAFVVMLYLVYLVECWHCHTRIQLQSKVDVNTVYDQIQAMREALPIVWWKATCYHYVRRTRQVTRYRNGDAFTTTQVYYERVNSHGASSAFNFSNCGIKDVSKTLVNLERFPATKIRFSKGFSFAAADSEQEYEEQRAEFFQEHERRDDYMETREGLDMMNTNFKEYVIAFADPQHLPWYVSQVVFWLASLMLLSWPLRVLIEYKTAYVHYHIHKLFGTSYLEDSSGRSAHISRVSTIASMDLERNIENGNFTMVPSYSEALLMDGGNGNRSEDTNYGSITPGSTRSIPNGYNQLPGFHNMYTKRYSSSTQLADPYLNGNSSLSSNNNNISTTAATIRNSTSSLFNSAATRGRHVILRIPQSVNNRLKRMRKQRRRHSFTATDAAPLTDTDGESSDAVNYDSSSHSITMHTGKHRRRRCPRSVSLQTARGLEAGIEGNGSGFAATSEPHMVQIPDSIENDHEMNAALLTMPLRLNDTIMEVDSEQNSPLPGRSMSSNQPSPPGSSCGSNTPLIGHSSPAHRHRTDMTGIDNSIDDSPVHRRHPSNESNNSSIILVHNALPRHRTASVDSNSSSTGPLLQTHMEIDHDDDDDDDAITVVPNYYHQSDGLMDSSPVPNKDNSVSHSCSSASGVGAQNLSNSPQSTLVMPNIKQNENVHDTPLWLQHRCSYDSDSSITPVLNNSPVRKRTGFQNTLPEYTNQDSRFGKNRGKHSNLGQSRTSNQCSCAHKRNKSDSVPPSLRELLCGDNYYSSSKTDARHGLQSHRQKESKTSVFHSNHSKTQNKASCNTSSTLFCTHKHKQGKNVIPLSEQSTNHDISSHPASQNIDVISANSVNTASCNSSVLLHRTCNHHNHHPQHHYSRQQHNTICGSTVLASFGPRTTPPLTHHSDDSNTNSLPVTMPNCPQIHYCALHAPLHIGNLPDSPPSYEAALGMSIPTVHSKVHSSQSDTDGSPPSNIRLMETAL